MHPAAQDYYSTLWYLTTTQPLGQQPPPHSSQGRVRTLDDMTAEEIAAIEAEYGAPVRRRVR